MANKIDTLAIGTAWLPLSTDPLQKQHTLTCSFSQYLRSPGLGLQWLFELMEHPSAVRLQIFVLFDTERKQAWDHLNIEV